MSGIFPNPGDGGLPPNPADLSNPARAYAPVTAPVGTAALYYGNGCDVRLRPEVVNSLISEIEATVDKAQLAYNPANQTNLQFAARYLIQRGLSRASFLTRDIPDKYLAALDPMATGLNNYMTLSVVPSHDNEGPVQINLDGYGYKPLLRDDGKDLQPKDITAAHPFEIIYYNGAWYHVGLVKSQAGGLTQNGDLYVNDSIGNDTLYDGLSPTVSGAHGPFKTINRAMVETFQYGPSIYTMTWHVANGSYHESVITPTVIGPTVIIKGENKVNTWVFGAPDGFTFHWSNGNVVYIESLGVSSPYGGFQSSYGASVHVDNCSSEDCGFNIFDAFAGYLFITNHNFRPNSDCVNAIAANNGGFIRLDGLLTFEGPLYCDNGFVAATNNGVIATAVPYLVTFSGYPNVSAYKYVASMNGAISTGGQGTSFYPGGAAGITSLGGQYS